MATAPQAESDVLRIQQKLGECQEVRPLPAAVSRLMAALQDPNTDVGSIAKIIEGDPALAIRLLRAANSPLFGFRSEVLSITHACTVLGTRRLRNLALSAAGAAMFAKGTSAIDARRKLWDHSLGCAAAARLLAQSGTSIGPDEAYLAGVFHDVGKLLFFDLVPEQFEPLTETCWGPQLIDREQADWQVTHEEIGLRSAHAWQLAEEIKVAIGYHHRPDEAPLHAGYAATIHLADYLVRSRGIGSKPMNGLTPAQSAVELLDLGPEQLDSIAEEANEVYQEIRKSYA